jgi:hypothetical protein
VFIPSLLITGAILAIEPYAKLTSTMEIGGNETPFSQRGRKDGQEKARQTARSAGLFLKDYRLMDYRALYPRPSTQADMAR